MPEEEASVSPLARREVAGEHKLANHPLLAAQLIWFVKGKNLVQTVKTVRVTIGLSDFLHPKKGTPHTENLHIL